MDNTAEKYDDYPTTEITLKPGILNIGRAPDNQLCLGGADTSLHHARIVTYFRQSFVTDLDSETGIYLNGTQVIKHSLKDGDILQLGHQTLLIRIPRFY